MARKSNNRTPAEVEATVAANITPVPPGVPPPGLYRLAFKLTNPAGTKVSKRSKPATVWASRDLAAGLLVKIVHVSTEVPGAGPVIEVQAYTPDFDCTYTNRCDELILGRYSDRARTGNKAPAHWYPNTSTVATLVRGALREITVPDLTLAETLCIFGVDSMRALRALIEWTNKHPVAREHLGPEAGMLLLCEALANEERTSDDDDTKDEVE